ncbi:MAG TPA: vitamin B12 dependent methionine synthase [Desulfobacteraceae bacterium]|nr:vitamin B12 dependent methionine synthase [Desulfobacteraceae bacterium]
MESYLIDDIKFNPDTGKLLKTLHVGEHSRDAGTINRMVSEARDIAGPKAFCAVCSIEKHGEDHVVIEGIEFRSRILRVNLDEAHRVFANVATCGVELDTWASRYNDILESFWADTIKENALRKAVEAVDAMVTVLNASGRISSMSPGSLEDWPITEQSRLFKLLGNGVAATGVRLTDSCLMLPTKSLSRFTFPSEHNFQSCKLCPRERCPGRRAPYDADLFASKYKPADI